MTKELSRHNKIKTVFGRLCTTQWKAYKKQWNLKNLQGGAVRETNIEKEEEIFLFWWGFLTHLRQVFDFVFVERRFGEDVDDVCRVQTLVLGGHRHQDLLPFLSDGSRQK